MTRKEFADTLKIYGFKMIKPSFKESDTTGNIYFYAYSKVSGLVYDFTIVPGISHAEACQLSGSENNNYIDASDMFFA